MTLEKQKTARPYQQIDRQFNTYGMEASTDNSKIMVISSSMNGARLYLGATLSKDDTPTTDIRIKMVTATAAVDQVYYKVQSVQVPHSTDPAFPM